MSFYQEARKTLHSSSAGKGLTQELVLRVLGLKSLAPSHRSVISRPPEKTDAPGGRTAFEVDG